MLELLSKIGCNVEKLNSIPYYENPFINRDWELINLGLPNWLNSIKLSFLNLKLRLLEYEAQGDTDNISMEALEDARKELYNFIGVSHVD